MNPTDDGHPGHNGVAQQAEAAGDARLAQALEEFRGLLTATIKARSANSTTQQHGTPGRC